MKRLLVIAFCAVMAISCSKTPTSTTVSAEEDSEDFAAWYGLDPGPGFLNQKFTEAWGVGEYTYSAKTSHRANGTPAAYHFSVCTVEHWDKSRRCTYADKKTVKEAFESVLKHELVSAGGLFD